MYLHLNVRKIQGLKYSFPDEILLFMDRNWTFSHGALEKLALRLLYVFTGEVLVEIQLYIVDLSHTKPKNMKKNFQTFLSRQSVHFQNNNMTRFLLNGFHIG